MPKNNFFKIISLTFFIVLFISCDKEFNVAGVDLIGENSFDIKKAEFSVVSYNQKLGPIQSNNMAINALGVYNNPSFGTTKATFVTQMSLALYSPDIDESAKIKSAVLSIPYFYDSSKTVLDSDTGASTYVLDSIYGPANAKMKLSVYESGFYMRDLDPSDQFTNAQRYYTNQFSEFAAVKKNVLLNNSTNTAENSAFFFDAAEHVVTTTTDGKETTTRSAPAMKLNLDKDFFEEKILKASEDVLASDVAFKDYFRGLFFDIETIGATPGNMAMINFKGGSITLTYTETIDEVETEKTLVINLTGNTVSFLDQTTTDSGYADATNPSNIDDVNGDAVLYLKGGEGSMSIIKLFGEDKFGADGISGAPNEVPDELDIIRSNNYLINQAELTFYLNSDAMGTSYVPQRIYLYDFTNNKVLIDYGDVTVGVNPKNNKFVFGGILAKDTDANGGGYYYKFRITDHIRNLVNDIEAENVDLGLVVTESISINSFSYLRDTTGFPLMAPLASVMNPLGAILFGNNIPSNDDNYNKRIKFDIYYTKTN
ncbi:DUF4270 domain-containing protein [Flavobacterium adhaerens]|uniref:DUF4270 domain-containing protein n=1 Tax=Flavobacterium adhaerens TaxID=3149043 RepID=UPI0032B4809B